MAKQNATKLQKKLPKRTGNAHKANKRAQSWARGQKRKAERREADKQRRDENRALRKEGVPTKWELIKAAHVGTRNQRFDNGHPYVLRYAKSGRLPKGVSNPGRTVWVHALHQGRTSTVVGWQTLCFNCGFKKSFLNQFTEYAYELAVGTSQDHVCVPSNWTLVDSN